MNKVATSRNDRTSPHAEVPNGPRRTQACSRARQSRPPATKDGSQSRKPKLIEKRDWSNFEEMFSALRLQFVRIAYRILQNHEDAEDAVQDALVSSYLHLGSFEGRSALKTWFTRVVLNAALMIRRKRKHPEIDCGAERGGRTESRWTDGIPSLEPDPEMCCARAETVGAIKGLIADLKPTLRQALTMCCLEEIPVHEAGASLGISTATFKARLFRARRQLVTEAGHFLADRSSRTGPLALGDQLAVATAKSRRTVAIR